MNIILAEDFLKSLLSGVCKFNNVTVVGDLDFGELKIDTLYLNNVVFEGVINGSITVQEITISGKNCTYYSNIMPLRYSGSLLKDLNS